MGETSREHISRTTHGTHTQTRGCTRERRRSVRAQKYPRLLHVMYACVVSHTLVHI